MIEVEAQIKNGSYHPLPMYAEQVREHKENQVVHLKVYGTEKARSAIQMNLYFACCNEVAHNTEHKRWNTKNKVDFQCRVELDFRDPEMVSVRPDGEIQFLYLSIAFKNLKHIAACNYFDRAFEVMAKFLGCTVDKLIEMAKNNMGKK